MGRIRIARAKATDIAEFAARNLNLKREGKYLVGACPRCGGDDRFAISTTKKVFNCRGCEKAGDVIDLAQTCIDGCDFVHACEILTGEPPPEEKPEPKKKKPNAAALGDIVETYNYDDAGGIFRFQVVRYDPKDFRQRRPNGNGGWIWNLNGVFPPLYHLPRLIEAVANGQTVVVVEGERDVHTAAAHRHWSRTCNVGGAGKWRGEYDAHFNGADVSSFPIRTRRA